MCPTTQAGRLVLFTGKIEGRVDFDAGYILRRFSCPQTVTHPSSKHLLVTPIRESNPQPVDCKYSAPLLYYRGNCTEMLRTFSGVFVVSSFDSVDAHAAGTDELVRPNLLHVQRTDLMLLTTTVRTVHEPTHRHHVK